MARFLLSLSLMKRSAIVFALLGLLLVACNQGGESDPSSQDASVNGTETGNADVTQAEDEREIAPLGGAANELHEQNYFKALPPEVFCGEAGYAYLLEEYFEPQCGETCHSSTGFVTQNGFPAFADPDPAIAYPAVLELTDQEIFDTVLENQFCQEFCELDPESEVFKAIEEWARYPTICP